MRVTFSICLKRPGHILPLPASGCGERAGETGKVRTAPHTVRFQKPRMSANRAVPYATRRAPHSPAHSPEYREEGGCRSAFDERGL